MKNRKRKLVSVCMAFCLLCSFSVQAAALIPPPPFAETTESTTQAAPQGPMGTTQESSAAPENSGGPGVTGGISGNTQGTTTPARPEIQAQGAVLMDASTGALLYEKNPDTRYYPASITKLMTALIVVERCNLDDTVTFSTTATTNLEAGSVSLNITAGDKLTVRQSLYALLLKSANEVANGLAEHVGGSVSGFAKLMNEKAKSLGCTNTNFTNPHGLNDSNHYTTARDMALIARAAFQNETLRKINTTLSYQIPATQKAAARTITMGHKMMYPSDARYYEGIIGGKTGYTSLAGNTLVTGAERNGVRLIAVIMKSKSTQYTDTKALLDYGFALKSGGVQSQMTGWVEDSTGWYYLKADGSRATSEVLAVNGYDYWFDDNAYMAVGWRKDVNGSWYYMKPSGAMAKNYWAKDKEKWFYLGENGVMLKNAATPDGYQVGEDGVLIE